MYARCHDSYFRLTHRQWIILNSEFIFIFNDWLIQTFFKVRSDCRVIWSYHRFMSSRSHVRCRNICAINNFQKTFYFLPQTIGSRRLYDVENPIQNNSNWTILPNLILFIFFVTGPTRSFFTLLLFDLTLVNLFWFHPNPKIRILFLNLKSTNYFDLIWYML